MTRLIDPMVDWDQPTREAILGKPVSDWLAEATERWRGKTTSYIYVPVPPKPETCGKLYNALTFPGQPPDAICNRPKGHDGFCCQESRG